MVLLPELSAHVGLGNGWIAAVGTFDPLTLAQAERLAKLGGNGKRVLGVVETSGDCLLPVEARAILLAALKIVKLVVIAEAEALAQYPELEIDRDDVGERQRTADFVAHIKQRQGAR